MMPLLNIFARTFVMDGTVYEINDLIFVIIGVLAMVITLVILPIIILLFVDLWKIAKKLGRKGWEGLIPIYNIYLLCRETGVNPWWILTIIFPPAFIILLIILVVRLCEGLSKSTLFSVFTPMFLPINLTIMAFDSSTWDAKRINFASAAFINDDEAISYIKKHQQSAKKSQAKKKAADDPWIEGK